MSRPRISISRSLGLLALLSSPLALVSGTLRGGSPFGLAAPGSLGLWPTLVAFGTATLALGERPRGRSPFLMGFAVVGWATVAAYLVVCLAWPDLVKTPILWYRNDLDAPWVDWLRDADRVDAYALNLLFEGLILALPSLVVATVGGLIAGRIKGDRWIST